MSPVANFGPFRYLAFLSSYRTRFDLVTLVIEVLRYTRCLA